jgi:hypothetical protein
MKQVNLPVMTSRSAMSLTSDINSKGACGPNRKLFYCTLSRNFRFMGTVTHLRCKRTKDYKAYRLTVRVVNV